MKIKNKWETEKCENMKLNNLQQMQKSQENSILKKYPEISKEDLFNKTLCELSVSVAKVRDCNNKQKVNEQRFEVAELNDTGEGQILIRKDKQTSDTYERHEAHKLTLIEDCSNCLYFILDLANQINLDLSEAFFTIPPVVLGNDYCYLYIQREIAEVLEVSYLIGVLSERFLSEKEWESICLPFQNLGDYYFNYLNSLGITLDELEQAYYEKNNSNN